MILLTRRYAFPAAHVLASTRLDDEENRRIFGKCANPNGHGHNYQVEVTVTGELDAVSGRIVSEELLDELFQETVGSRYSHRMLNETPAFQERVPTAENIARVVYEELAPVVESRSPAHLYRVRLVETARNSCETGEST